MSLDLLILLLDLLLDMILDWLLDMISDLTLDMINLDRMTLQKFVVMESLEDNHNEVLDI